MKSDYKYYLTKAAAYCSRSEHCVAEVEEKLIAWGADRQDIPTMMSHLIEERFVDHTRYATFFVRDKFRLNGWGKQKLFFMLRSKRVEEDVIVEALNQIDNEAYCKKLLDLLTQKRETVQADDTYQLKEKLYRFASSRGFEPEIIKKAVEIVLKP